MDKAEDIINKRRQVIRKKQVKQVKQIVAEKDFNSKSQKINRQIESVNNIFFGGTNSKYERNFTKLYTELKK